MPVARFSRPAVCAFVTLACTVLAQGHAAAHPHVWIDAKYRIDMGGGDKVEAIDVEWTFDPAYSSFLAEDLDATGDGVPDDDKLQAMARDNIEALAEFGWFVVMRAGESIVDGAPPQVYAYGFQDGRLTLSFKLPLSRPVDPRTERFNFSGFDPMFYIDIRVQGQGDVTVAGATDCGAIVLEPQRHDTPLAGGTWQRGIEIENDAYLGLGDLFAQRIDLRC